MSAHRGIDELAVIVCDAPECTERFKANTAIGARTRNKAEKHGWRAGNYRDRRDFCPAHAVTS